MTLQDITDHLNNHPIDGVDHYSNNDRIVLTMGPVQAQITLDPNQDASVEVMGTKDGQTVGAVITKPEELSTWAIRCILNDYLSKHPRDPFNVYNHVIYLHDGGVYAKALRRHLTMARDNLNQTLEMVAV